MMQITLKAARVNAGYTQKRAADLLGVSNGTLLSWETGKTCPTINRVDALCKLYGCKREEILFPLNSL